MRASRPLSPFNVRFDSAYFPATVSNSSGVVITWDRRANVPNLSGIANVTASRADTAEAGVEYFARHGLGVLANVTNMGASNSFTLTLQFKGVQNVEVFARKAGVDSEQRLIFTTNVLNASGTMAVAELPLIEVSAFESERETRPWTDISTSTALIAVGAADNLTVRSSSIASQTVISPIVQTAVDSYQIWRVRSLATVNGNGYFGIRDIEYWSNAEIVPVIVSGSANPGSFPATNAVDNDLDTFWTSLVFSVGGQNWFDADFGVGNAVSLKYIKLRPRTDFGEAPTSMIIEGSNDGTTFNVVSTFNAIPTFGTSETRLFNVGNNSAANISTSTTLLVTRVP